MTSKLSSKHKKLFLKAEYLNEELKEVTALFEEYKKEFIKKISEYKNKRSEVYNISKSLKDNLKDISEEEGCEDRVVDKQNPAMKGLYRKIMLKAHPDKLHGVEDSCVKNFYSKICSKAMEAMESDNWHLLFSAAMDLGIEDIDITDDHINMLQQNSKAMEEKIINTKKTLPWVWFNGNQKVKKACIEQYLR